MLIFNDTDLQRWKRWWSRGQTHGSCEKDSPGHVRRRAGQQQNGGRRLKQGCKSDFFSEAKKQILASPESFYRINTSPFRFYIRFSCFIRNESQTISLYFFAERSFCPSLPDPLLCGWQQLFIRSKLRLLHTCARKTRSGLKPTFLLRQQIAFSGLFSFFLRVTLS